MRYCRFIDGDRPRLGEVVGDAVHPLPAGTGLDGIIAGETGDHRAPRDLAGLTLAAPLEPGKIIGIALNYRAHAEETGREIPAEPRPFAKLATAVTGPSDPIRAPGFSSELDYEGELAVVIGRRARRVGSADALGHVLGYMVMNDVSARDAQRAEPQWLRAKGCDTFAPCGPWLTRAEAVGDPQDLRLRTWVNDEIRQDGRTNDMIFDVADLIAWISQAVTLEPGDVIATGTPSGVGVAMDPQRFLVGGDRVRIEIEGLGSIENTVEADA